MLRPRGLVPWGSSTNTCSADIHHLCLSGGDSVPSHSRPVLLTQNSLRCVSTPCSPVGSTWALSLSGGQGEAAAAWRHPGAQRTYQRPQEHLGPWFKTTVVKSAADPLRRPLE